jgi:hypothetical protein
MAISADTTAVVAAQLTAAWAARSGVREDDKRIPVEAEILATYTRFRQAVAEPENDPASGTRWEGKAALAGFLELLRVLSKSGRLASKEASQIETQILRNLPQAGTLDPSLSEVVFAVQATVAPLVRASRDRSPLEMHEADSEDGRGAPTPL